MIRPMRWTERRFAFDLPAGWFPAIIERLDGLPARAAALIEQAGDELLSIRPEGHWSVKEHMGHLADLHDLDTRRLDEFLSGAQLLSAADMTNRRTHEAGHHVRSTTDLLAELKAGRNSLVGQLRRLEEADVLRSSMHPRLNQPMRLIDWAYFVAEHDDHHLAHARAVNGDGPCVLDRRWILSRSLNATQGKPAHPMWPAT